MRISEEPIKVLPATQLQLQDYWDKKYYCAAIAETTLTPATAIKRLSIRTVVYSKRTASCIHPCGSQYYDYYCRNIGNDRAEICGRPVVPVGLISALL